MGLRQRHVCRLAGLQPGNVRRSQAMQTTASWKLPARKFVSGNGKLDVLVFGQSINGGSPSSLLMLPGNGTGALGTAVTSSINIAPTLVVAAKMNHDTNAGRGARRLRSQRIWAAIVRAHQPGQWNIRRGTGLHVARAPPSAWRWAISMATVLWTSQWACLGWELYRAVRPGQWHARRTRTGRLFG